MKVWHKQDIDFLIKEYENYSLIELSNKLGRTVNSIYSKASSLMLSHQKYNKKFMMLKSRKYSIDNSFLDVIDSEKKSLFFRINVF